MLIHCTPSILQPIELIGAYAQQLEAARKYCLIAHSKGARHVTIHTGDGYVSGAPICLLKNLTAENWKAHP